MESGRKNRYVVCFFRTKKKFRGVAGFEPTTTHTQSEYAKSKDNPVREYLDTSAPNPRFAPFFAKERSVPIGRGENDINLARGKTKRTDEEEDEEDERTRRGERRRRRRERRSIEGEEEGGRRRR